MLLILMAPKPPSCQVHLVLGNLSGDLERQRLIIREMRRVLNSNALGFVNVTKKNSGDLLYLQGRGKSTKPAPGRQRKVKTGQVEASTSYLMSELFKSHHS